MRPKRLRGTISKGKVHNFVKSNVEKVLRCTFGLAMPELQEIKTTLSRIDKLERDIGLKQLQINSLLTITQAINENVPAVALV